ncbi:MAG: hypothetical protein QF582_10025 [Alphaproteobacteria bacterium]|jgi:hypothetical protein|nr:hypothetical protein [Alphaproteobacteria bacterium]
MADYWLEYWIAALRHIQSRQDRLVVVSYERLCAGGAGVLADICETLGLSEASMPDDAAAMIRQPSVLAAEQTTFQPALRRRAQELHRELLGN